MQTRLLPPQSLAFEDLQVGMSASCVDEVTTTMIRDFGSASGDFNPIHFNAEYASHTRFKKPIAHGLLTASLISKVLGTQLPGGGTIYVSQTFNFRAPVHAGDTVTSTVNVVSLDATHGFATLDVKAEVHGNCVLDGRALVMPRRASQPA